MMLEFIRWNGAANFWDKPWSSVVSHDDGVWPCGAPYWARIKTNWLRIKTQQVHHDLLTLFKLFITWVTQERSHVDPYIPKPFCCFHLLSVDLHVAVLFVATRFAFLSDVRLIRWCYYFFNFCQVVCVVLFKKTFFWCQINDLGRIDVRESARKRDVTFPSFLSKSV